MNRITEEMDLRYRICPSTIDQGAPNEHEYSRSVCSPITRQLRLSTYVSIASPGGGTNKKTYDTIGII